MKKLEILYPAQLSKVSTRVLKKMTKGTYPWFNMLPTNHHIQIEHVYAELSSRKSPKAPVWVLVFGSATILSAAIALITFLSHPNPLFK